MSLELCESSQFEVSDDILHLPHVGVEVAGGDIKNTLDVLEVVWVRDKRGLEVCKQYLRRGTHLWKAFQYQFNNHERGSVDTSAVTSYRRGSDL